MHDRHGESGTFPFGVWGKTQSAKAEIQGNSDFVSLLKKTGKLTKVGKALVRLSECRDGYRYKCKLKIRDEPLYTVSTLSFWRKRLREKL